MIQKDKVFMEWNGMEWKENGARHKKFVYWYTILATTAMALAVLVIILSL